MDEDTPELPPDTPAPSNVRQFRFPRPRTGAPPPPLIAKGDKLAMYPLAEDVIISNPLFSVILVTLTQGSMTEREQLAEMLKSGYAVPFM